MRKDKKKNQATSRDPYGLRDPWEGMAPSPEESKQKKKKKLSKSERKALEKQQAENEKRLIKEGVISERVKYAPRSFLWNAICVCLAFFLGIFFAIGAVILAGSKSSVKSLLGMVGIDSSKLIAEEYENESLINLFYDLKSTEFTNLNSLGKFTPLLGNSLNSLSEQFAVLGVHIDVSELMGVGFGELGSYFQENVVQTIVLGDTLGLKPDSSPLMIAICYGEEGVDFDVTEEGFVMRQGKSPTTIADLTNNASDMLGRVTVESALNVNANSAPAMRYLAYGTEGEHYDIVEGAIVMRLNAATGEPFRKKPLNSITANGTDFIGDARVKDLIDMSNANEFMTAVQDWRVTDLKNTNRINRLKISQIINTETSTSLLMKAIKDWRIKDLTNQNNINSLTLGDVIEIREEGAEGGASPKILRTLKNSTIGNFGKAIDNVRLADILDDDLSKNDFLRSLQSSTLLTLAGDIQNLTVSDVFGDKLYSYASLAEIKGLAPAGQTFDSYADYLSYYTSDGRKDAAYSERRPTALKNITPTSSLVLKSDPSVKLTEGWFANGVLQEIPDNDVHTDTADGEQYFYIENKIRLTAVYVWKIVNYNAPSSEWQTVSVTESKDGITCRMNEKDYPVSEDAYSYYFYAANEEGVWERIDLDKQILRYEMGNTPIEGEPAGYQKPTDEAEGYYYIYERVVVEKRYYSKSDSAGTSYSIEETKQVFFGKADEASEEIELDRYLGGIWFLLLSKEGGDGEKTRIVDLSDEVSRASELLDRTVLWQLYVHDLISINPYKQIGSVNMNEKTIADVIYYMKNGNF